MIRGKLEKLAFVDLEDCRQSGCARNIKDFEVSEVPAVLPENFLSVVQC